MSRNAERMQYQLDRLSYWLCMLSIVFNVAYFISIYTSVFIEPDITIGADVVINIIFMLIVFLGGEKLKAYQKKWNFYVILIGAVQILRIFFIPMHYYQLEIVMGSELEHILAVTDLLILAVSFLLVSGTLLILAGMNSSINLKILSRHEGRRVGE